MPSREQQPRRDNRPPRRNDRPRQQRASAPQPQQPRPLAATLDALKTGAVDFRGRTIEPEKKPHATDVSVSFVSDNELKDLIARALGKK